MKEIICKECENWKRRGDEFFDQLETEKEACLSLRSELGRHVELYDEKCDEYRKLIHLNGNLRLLLSENGVGHDF